MDIKKILKEKGISYQELADRINSIRPAGARKATTASLSQIINSEPSIKSLREIAAAIGCKVGDFFLDETTEKPVINCMIEYEGKCHAFHELSEAVDFIRDIVDTKKLPKD